MGGNGFDKEVMPSARVAREEDQREFRGLWVYICIAVLVVAAILGIVAVAVR